MSAESDSLVPLSVEESLVEELFTEELSIARPFCIASPVVEVSWATSLPSDDCDSSDAFSSLFSATVPIALLLLIV